MIIVFFIEYLMFLQIWLWNDDLGAFGDLFTYNTLRWFIQLIFTSFTCLKKIKRSNIYIRFFSFFCSLPLNAYISPIVYSAPFLNKLNITLLIHSSSWSTFVILKNGNIFFHSCVHGKLLQFSPKILLFFGLFGYHF